MTVNEKEYVRNFLEQHSEIVERWEKSDNMMWRAAAQRMKQVAGVEQ